jgi:DNA-binding NarL/FixJ family response regulator
MIRVFAVDDHPLVAMGLKGVFAETEDIRLAGSAGTGLAAIEALDKGGFDVLLLDIELPDRSGLEVLRHARTNNPRLPVIMLSIYEEKLYAVRAIRGGAAGYVTKNSLGEQLVDAIRKVHAGGRYITTSLAEQLASTLALGDKLPHEQLSDRELRVMQLLASGRNVTEAAKELHLGRQTVTTYRRRILDKMGFSTNSEIARYALANGLLKNG